jgi:hypothetical protein
MKNYSSKRAKKRKLAFRTPSPFIFFQNQKIKKIKAKINRPHSSKERAQASGA